MNKKNIKLVFFDLGSVLIHVHIERFFTAFTQHTTNSLESVKQRSETMKGVVTEFNCGRIKPVDFYNRVCNGFGDISFEDFTRIYTNIFTLNKDIARIVSQLERHVRLSIISNTDELHFGYIMQHFPVMQLFENPVTSFMAHSVKPGKEIFLYALNRVQLYATECLFIDDNHENVDAAIDLGFFSLQYTGTEKLIKDLKIFGFNL
ncbi:HAD family phosphatase [candidate division KSB1 bacterium]|nr:HAD family phosphatase [candidate division KSB1 bacterium]